MVDQKISEVNNEYSDWELKFKITTCIVVGNTVCFKKGKYWS